jgi:tetratricopeptide (TPR) repeat protein
MVHDAKQDEPAIAAYAEAIRLDPSYALALAAQSPALTDYADSYATGSAIRASYESGQADARLAIARAPALADGYVALANVLESESLDFAQAAKEYQRAVSLAPGNAQVAWRLGRDYQAARASCEGTQPLADAAGSYFGIQVCLAITCEKLGRLGLLAAGARRPAPQTAHCALGHFWP